MIVTVEWMQKKFKEFNKKYWNEEINVPFFKTSRSKSMFGQAECNIDCFGNPYKFVLKMSVYYDQTEHYLEETFLHEMIHLYEYQTRPHIFKIAHYDFHGVFFRKEAERINVDGYNIQKFVQQEKSSSCKVSEHYQTILDKKKNRGYNIALCRCKEQNKYHAYKLNEKNLKEDFPAFCKRAWAKANYDEYTIYHTRYDEFLNSRCGVQSYFILDADMIKGIKNEGTIIKTKAIG